MAEHLKPLEIFIFSYGFELPSRSILSFQPEGLLLPFLVAHIMVMKSFTFVYLGISWFLPLFRRTVLPAKVFSVLSFQHFKFVIPLSSGLQGFSVEKSTVNLTEGPWYVTSLFVLTAFKILSLSFNSLIILCLSGSLWVFLLGDRWASWIVDLCISTNWGSFLFSLPL